MRKLIPLFIALGVTALLYYLTHWWGFLVIFPWIGGAITLGNWLRGVLPKPKQVWGRKVALLLILPMLLFFVPIVNSENFQLEGVVLIVLVGFFSKGFIHYAIAKLFGPLIWGRGFCGWACWTAAVIEWLPIRKVGAIPPRLKHLRYLALALSVGLPLVLVFGLSYDVRGEYINRAELAWMMIGNAIYYLLAIPLAFAFKDQRAFCKVACPVALVMKVPARFAAIKVGPTGKTCTECGVCNKLCPMDIDVMSRIREGRKIVDTECILCDVCKLKCPAGAIR